MTLRAKFLLALLLISAGLTISSLVVVRRVVSRHVRGQIVQDLRNSVATFENVQRQRETSLIRSAALMADLPIVRALMTTRHPVTIQDASTELWQTAGSDMLVLADGAGTVMAVQSKSGDLTRDEIHSQLIASTPAADDVRWWIAKNHLFEVATRPIYLGPVRENRLVGFIAVGSEIDEKVAHQLSQVAASEVVFRAGDRLVRSTLPAEQQKALAPLNFGSLPRSNPQEIRLGDEKFLAEDVQLSAAPVNVRLTVLKSLDQSTQFLSGLDRLIMVLGLLALVLGAALVWIISRTITKPLRSLVAGVRALGESDFEYPLSDGGRDEVAELTAAFSRMRADLQESQRELLDSERLATIGRMASSISHDLRHHLSAIMSSAEFLSDTRREIAEREELYEEIRIAVVQMNEMIDSLLEFSRTRESLRLHPAHPEEAIHAAVQGIRLRPEFRSASMEVNSSGTSEGAYDIKRLERVFHNLLLNACEAAYARPAKVLIDVRESDHKVEIRVSDNGRGIPDYHQQKIFEPFFTHGKANGTGLGLTIAQKIVQDHGGDLRVEKTSEEGTVILVVLPLLNPADQNYKLTSSTPASVV
ncbi:MAG TPA: HAMP domain-containing sensor histidine kinase [Terriglobales bacterium]|nr:HAMP domain-containing sensor histidine kinase [Terriglobales bacterium]